MSKPSVLFVCVHNAGRSQMAAGYLTHLAGDRVEVRSAGSQPADQINPIAVAAMAEDGIDITTEHPKILTTDAVQASDVVITMGCGDTCPVFPGKRYEDWELDDPADQGIDAVRPIREEIKRRVRDLIASLGITEDRKPSVLFVCAKNGGKSQVAAALLRQHAGDRIDVHSAGTQPGPALNPESVASLDEVGATTAGEHPKPIDPTLLDAVDRVIILGNDAVIEHPGAAPIERWDTDEPSLRGITGMQRMRLIRDDINTRVENLTAALLPGARR